MPGNELWHFCRSAVSDLGWFGRFFSGTKEVLSSLGASLLSQSNVSSARDGWVSPARTPAENPSSPKCHQLLCRPGVAATPSTSLQNSTQRVLENHLHNGSGGHGAEPTAATSPPVGSHSPVGAKALFWGHKTPHRLSSSPESTWLFPRHFPCAVRAIEV